jgi:peptide/nickel transport system permease protein
MRPAMRILDHPALVAGLVLTVAIAGVAVLSLVWLPYDPTRMAMIERLRGPSAAHWLGTDQFGRDVAAMLMRGAANALFAGVVSVMAGSVVGSALGLAAAALNGSRVDESLMRSVDFIFAFPAVLSAIMIAQLTGPGAQGAILAIAIFNVPVFARLTRAAALSIGAREFVMAARALGETDLLILRRHVLPNMAGLILIQASVQIALAILAEAGLSYLGVGTQPPNPSWGRMLNDAQTFLNVQPLLAIFPGAAIALAVFGFNLLGDGLRDLIDHRSRKSLF